MVPKIRSQHQARFLERRPYVNVKINHPIRKIEQFYLLLELL
jgi:hypothetical protein